MKANRGAVRPGPTYDGESYYSSGQIGGAGFPSGIAYALRFDTPGTFQYLYLLHFGEGVIGEITVLSRE